MRRTRRFSSSAESHSLEPSSGIDEPQEEDDDHLLADIEQFNVNIEQFRSEIFGIMEGGKRRRMQQGGEDENVPYLRAHSLLLPLSKSIRLLWGRYPKLFKSAPILQPAGRLVSIIKGATAAGQFNGNKVLETLDQLENAVANALQNELLFRQERSKHCNTKFRNENGEEIDEDDDDIEEDDIDEEEEEEEKISVKSAKATSSSGVSSSPNGPIKILRRHSAFQLPVRPYRQNKFASPPARSQQQQKGGLICPTKSLQLPKENTKNDCSNTRLGVNLLPKKTTTSNSPAAIIINQRTTTPQCSSMLVELLEQRNDGMELAFERCKCWSKFASQLLVYARNKLSLDLEYGQRQQKIAEQHLAVLASSAWSNVGNGTQMMPLASLFGRLMEENQKFAKRAEATVQELQQRFVASLESRQKEHDAKRRKMKADYAKCRKQMESCMEELRRARQAHTIKGEQYLRARDVTLRQERECHQMLPSAMKLPNGQMLISNEQLFQKRRREVEKRRRAEGEALNRKSDAELEVCRLEQELNQRRTNLAELRCRTVAELADLIRQCELTTIACTSTLLKGIAALWGPVPGEMEQLAEMARSSQPAKEFLTFLQEQQQQSTALLGHGSQCPTSASSLAEGQQISTPQVRPAALLGPDIGGGESGKIVASISTSMPSPSRAIQRRNALTAAEEHLLMAEAQQHQKRRGKTSVGRLFDYSQISPSTSSTSAIEQQQPSEAAKSHRLQRTRQVTKCAQCEHLLLFDALKCASCALVWHRKCLGQVQLWCGPSAASQSLLSSGVDKRRTSIFGVALKGHLEAQQRQVPLILERCIDELQRRGMGCKGIYRTCGVKSKVEEICAQFEQNPPNARVDLAAVHPMNIASVVKLYLRRLPEPLLTFNLYAEWLRVNEESAIDRESIQNVLANLVKQLPEPNFHTLSFLMRHLNRVTWYEHQNLMSCGNLAAVIAPSLIWQRLPSMSALNSAPLFQSPQFINDAHRQTRTIELLILHAFEVFGVDREADRRQFFLDYPEVTPPPENAETQKIGSAEIVPPMDDELEVGEEEEEDEEELLEEEMELLVTTAVEPVKLRTRSLGIGGIPAAAGCDSGIASSSGANSEAAANQKKEGMESSSSDLDCGSSAASTFHRHNQQQQQQKLQKIYPNSNSSNSRPPLLPTGPSTAPSTRRLNGKQRSFTTSILVSPLADRRNMPPPPPLNTGKQMRDQQEGTPKRPMLTQRSLEEAPEKPNRKFEGALLRSGEVTVQLGQDCTAAPNEKDQGERRHSQHAPSSSYGPYPSTDTEDVSYV